MQNEGVDGATVLEHFSPNAPKPYRHFFLMHACCHHNHACLVQVLDTHRIRMSTRLGVVDLVMLACTALHTGNEIRSLLVLDVQCRLKTSRHFTHARLKPNPTPIAAVNNVITLSDPKHRLRDVAWSQQPCVVPCQSARTLTSRHYHAAI